MLPRLWDLYLLLPQLVCPLLSEGLMMRDGFVAQLEVCWVMLKRLFFVTADALKIRVVDVRMWKFWNLESQGDPDNSLCISKFLM